MKARHTKTTGDEPVVRGRIMLVDRECACGAPVLGLARRTQCKQCWVILMERIHGMLRALELEAAGMYERIDD